MADLRNQEMFMSNSRRLIFSVAALLLVQLAAGCALLDKEEELDISRRVGVLVFPVRHLEFDNLKCRQESNKIDLSGSVKNVSYSMLSNVRLQADILCSGEISSHSVMVPVQPPVLESGQGGQFSLSEEVDCPVRHIELHAFWGSPSPR